MEKGKDKNDNPNSKELKKVEITSENSIVNSKEEPNDFYIKDLRSKLGLNAKQTQELFNGDFMV